MSITRRICVDTPNVHRNDEIKLLAFAWCNFQFGQRGGMWDAYSDGTAFYFDNEQDAIFFSLKWCGHENVHS